MISRCYNPNHDSFRNYGARGISVCDRWRKSYAAFLDDMGRSPGPHFTIDRIDNDGNYTPENCRWATRTEQNNNQRQRRRVKSPYIRHIIIAGVQRTLSEWLHISSFNHC